MIKFNKKIFFEAFKNKKNFKPIILSQAFGAYCEKYFIDNNFVVVKGYRKKNIEYNSILYEAKSLNFMNKKFPNLFPKIYFMNRKMFVMQHITNNQKKNKNTEKDLAIKISKIHQIKNNKFGFKYDTPIGGFRQPSNFQKSWISFYANKRLGHIFEEINKSNPMPKKINFAIESILKNLKNLIPDNPEPSLIHGDLWSGNMLFNNGKLVGLIDPSICYVHKEMEISYLKWFNSISKNFYHYYSENIDLDKDFFKYSEIYELYYSLLNVHLWDRKYIHNVEKLTRKFRER
tara:strand:+ start:2023 stop:2889 length:867 start_codon:yes stop_codon:yes gene_type:complete